MTEPLALGYSAEITWRELSNEYQHNWVRWFSKIIATSLDRTFFGYTPNTRGNSQLVQHSNRLIKEGGFVDLSMNAMHLKDPLVLFGSEGSGFTLFLLSLRIIMICHCSSAITKDHFLVIYHNTKWPLCADTHLNPPSFIYFRKK